MNPPIDRGSFLYRACKTDEAYVAAQAQLERQRQEQRRELALQVCRDDLRVQEGRRAAGPTEATELRRLVRQLEDLVKLIYNPEFLLRQLFELAANRPEQFKDLLAPALLEITERFEQGEL